jgi:hypothetical protein
VDRLTSRLGDVSLAAEIQLLKRDLCLGHAILSARPEDNDYLSVVTLVEGALASLTWKGYTPGFLNVLRRAFAAGADEGEFTFEAYDAIRRDFKASGISTGPTIDPAVTDIANPSAGCDAQGVVVGRHLQALPLPDKHCAS